MRRHADAIVVGCGAIGAAASASLARRGAEVVAIEQFTRGHDRGSSHGGSRVYRESYFEADAYAKETHKGEALANALKKLSVDNLSNLYPHPVYVFFHYSHPPLLKRLEKIGSKSF